jgi:hypothetical protein
MPVISKHNIGDLASDIGALSAHGDADVGDPKRRAVVNAAASHCDNMAIGLQCLHDVELVDWLTRANTCG